MQKRVSRVQLVSYAESNWPCVTQRQEIVGQRAIEVWYAKCTGVRIGSACLRTCCISLLSECGLRWEMDS